MYKGEQGFKSGSMKKSKIEQLKTSFENLNLS